MIHKSAPWKDRLLRDAELIDRWAAKPSATERRSLLIENKVFVSAYAMRKLFEAEKLSSNLGSYNVQALRFDILPDRVLTWCNTRSFDEVFDLNLPTGRSVNVLESP